MVVEVWILIKMMRVLRFKISTPDFDPEKEQQPLITIPIKVRLRSLVKVVTNLPKKTVQAKIIEFCVGGGENHLHQYTTTYT